jgi:hypothetical protein
MSKFHAVAVGTTMTDSLDKCVRELALLRGPECDLEIKDEGKFTGVKDAFVRNEQLAL